MLQPRYIGLTAAETEAEQEAAQQADEGALLVTLDSAVPDAAKTDLEANSAFPAPGARVFRSATGDYFEPAEPERSCFDTPGPADPQLYCVRTVTKSWIGFKWYPPLFAQILGRLFHNLDRVCRYRFVDQPELNQVFASLPTDAERTAAKDYMQARIERLHAFQQQDGAEPRWFDAPGGSDSLPKAKVEIDR